MIIRPISLLHPRQLARHSVVRSFASSQRQNGRPRTISDLGRKVEIEVTALGRFANLAPPRRGRDICQRVGSTYGGSHSLAWITQPHTVLIIAKRSDPKSLLATRKIIEFILESRPELSIIVEPEIFAGLGELSSNLIPLPDSDIKLLPTHVDFVIALGGDGTLLRVSSLFDAGAVPPVLGINMGSLGFLMPTHIESFPSALEELLESRASLLLRMRLQCAVTDADGSAIVLDNGNTTAVHAMNEVTLHRGASQHLTIIDTYVDKQLFTESVADGLLLATPTGSTAYSLSAGGPIVHPSVQSLLLTPIAPRSLSFRPVLLPSDVSVDMRISPLSRGNASLALDGHEVRTLLPSQLLTISMSPFPIPCVSPLITRSTSTSTSSHEKTDDERRSRGSDDPWVRDIRRMLRFNAPFQGGATENS